jgi:lysozyme
VRAYQDIRGVWTIAWGHTGPEVVDGLVWTQAQCDQQFSKDLAHFEQQVRDSLKVEVNQNEFDAMVSFTYNVGHGALLTSTFLRLLNLNQRRAAACHLCLFCKAGGLYSDGLNVRRADEALQFMGII